MRNLISSQSRSLFRRPRATRTRRLSLECLEARSLLAAVSPPSGLISWWTADNTAADLMGLNNATMYNGATFAPGEVGQAFSFDGVGARVQVADSDSLKLTASMTIEGWIKVNAFSTTHGEIFFRGDDRGGLDPYSLSTEPNGTLSFQVTTISNTSSVVQAPVPLGQFIHVAATLDDATGAMKLYENGAVVAQTVTTLRPFRDLDPASNPSIGIGNHGGYPTSPHNFPFNGLIDELSVYNRAITASEIFAIYSAGSAGKIKAPNYFAADYPTVLDGPVGSTPVVTFTISRVGSLAGQAVVNWTTAGGTAIPGTDYVAASGQVVFQDGESQKTVQVTVNGDNTPEPNKTFWLVLSTTTPGYAAGGGLATIVGDDTAVSVNDVTVNEGDATYRFMDYLVPPDAYGLAAARNIRIGPDGNVYVASHDTNVVKVFDPVSGGFLRDLGTSGGELTGPWGMTFGPDGMLYVGGRYSLNVIRFNVTTGAYEVFVSAANSGGLGVPKGLAFGSDGNLYVSSNNAGALSTSDTVKRYSGATGAYLGDFVTAGSGGLDGVSGVAFGPDGNFYVLSGNNGNVLRYNGQTGSFLGVFIAGGSGGLTSPSALHFQPDGTLYVCSGNGQQILRYNATTGAFLGIFASGPATGDIAFAASGEAYVSQAMPTLQPGSAVLRYAPASFYAAFTVSLSQPVPSTVTVNYNTSDGSALAGSDYLATNGTLVFSPGETTQTVLVRTLDDANTAPTETFTLNLSNPSSSATITRAQGAASIREENATKFLVVNDGSSLDQTYRYSRNGSAAGNSALNSGDTAPRGDASTAAGTTVWVVDANKKVYVYNTSGGLLGSWSAGSLSSHALVEGIATNGTDVWILDASQQKVYRYANAGGRLSGSQSAASSFTLSGSDSNPKDLVTDGTSFWVVDAGSSTDQVFKYTLSGSLLGSWTLGAGSSPTGITLDPTNVSALWVVDNVTDRVYQYDNAASLTSGSLFPSTSFALAAGNTNPQGLADPPAPNLLTAATPRSNEASGSAPRAQPVSTAARGDDLEVIVSPALGQSLGFNQRDWGVTADPGAQGVPHRPGARSTTSRVASKSLHATRHLAFATQEPDHDRASFAAGQAPAGPRALRSRLTASRHRS